MFTRLSTAEGFAVWHTNGLHVGRWFSSTQQGLQAMHWILINLTNTYLTY